MRFVEMQEQEERLANAVEPLRCRRQGLQPWPLQPAELQPGIEPNIRVVHVEPAVDPGPRPQHVGRHEAARREAVAAQLRRECRARLVQAVADVVAHSMLRRQQAGEQADVGRQSEVGVSEGALEQDSIPSQAIDRRRLHSSIAVSGQPIRTQRVDRDQHHVGTGGAGRNCPVRNRRCRASHEKAGPDHCDRRRAAHGHCNSSV